MDELSEQIAKAKEGDSLSLEKIVKQFSPQARALARRSFLVGGDVEDLHQEGLLAIIYAVKAYDEEKNDNFAAFVSMCIRSRIIDTIRSATRGKHRLLNEAMLSDQETLQQIVTEGIDDPITSYLERERRTDFRESLAKILSKHQLALLDLYFEGFSYREIAEKLSITEKKVDNTLSTIKSKIKKQKGFFIQEEEYE